MAQVSLEPGALPPKDKLNPVKGKDGLWRLTRIRHRSHSGEYVKTSAVGRTRRECLDEWEQAFKRNVHKGSKRKRTSKRRQFSATDKMGEVFAELDAQYKARVDAGKMSQDTYNNYRCYIYPPAKNAKRSKNPD
ncbi:hypothetical protein IU501_35085 [Nocardia otitidiscaviarum]|uniref:hypothetical protein n=1 Tax=Nocardia otitidiscaviarum TaxID=1823 RepID=UPI0011DDB248|nr:hypothetical protein [Nocardia otitidiscaviarum]MBF6138198.1 hypothetical protein [Nocardia otitidiscaviarum]MBF6488989.1 hypothetical protein [Nocardia otitidiscaviarum]